MWRGNRLGVYWSLGTNVSARYNFQIIFTSQTILNENLLISPYEQKNFNDMWNSFAVRMRATNNAAKSLFCDHQRSMKTSSKKRSGRITEMSQGQKTGRNNKSSRVDKAGWWHCITANFYSELEIPRQTFNCGYSSRFTLGLVALANGEATANDILKWKCLGEISTSKKLRQKNSPWQFPS